MEICKSHIYILFIQASKPSLVLSVLCFYLIFFFCTVSVVPIAKNLSQQDAAEAGRHEVASCGKRLPRVLQNKGYNHLISGSHCWWVQKKKSFFFLHTCSETKMRPKEAAQANNTDADDSWPVWPFL